jgi:hypothetical protein
MHIQTGTVEKKEPRDSFGRKLHRGLNFINCKQTICEKNLQTHQFLFSSDEQ